jgi:hypothetical protein
MSSRGRPGPLMGVFAPLVRAQVFKTCGGCEQRSLSVRFRYTPVGWFFWSFRSISVLSSPLSEGPPESILAYCVRSGEGLRRRRKHARLGKVRDECVAQGVKVDHLVAEGDASRVHVRPKHLGSAFAVLGDVERQRTGHLLRQVLAEFGRECRPQVPAATEVCLLGGACCIQRPRSP